MFNKMIVFDMDGTLANFYGVENWLDMIRSGNATPYKIAEPLYDIDTLNIIFDMLRALGYRIAITSWLAKNSTREFDTQVRNAKYSWIKKVGLEVDEIHIVKYGTPKADVTRKNNCFQILVDDEDNNLDMWDLGTTIDAKKNVVNQLLQLIDKEI